MQVAYRAIYLAFIVKKNNCYCAFVFRDDLKKIAL